MAKDRLKGSLKLQIQKAQKTEITEHFVYRNLAKSVKGENNRKVLQKISEEEKKHADIWKGYTEEEIKPDRFRVFYHGLIARLLGFTFAVKLMEKGEEKAQINYDQISKEIPEAKRIMAEESSHEKALLNILDEDNLKYVGSMVLGLNDALVELTGAMAGLTLALQNTRLIAVTGLITGIAASLSMGASEYLSTKAEAKEKNPLKASIYTGGMYMVTVAILIIPFFVFSNVFLSIAVTLFMAILIILFFTFYISVAQDLPFKKRFLEMTILSLSVSVISFGIGYIVQKLVGVKV
jgi:VIT1/CCC1 family predicted Fe2+/Mn2+ transporter